MDRSIVVSASTDEEEIDYQAFVDGQRTMVVAPAGYGKTYTIVNCLKYTSGRQLILTHTHAGIASIKEKIASLGIPRDRYRIETISSFSQKYVNAFHVSDDIPDQEDREYHTFIVSTATSIFQISHVRDILKISYSGLFVDEYQDCTQRQHELVNALSQALPIHILGDHMQGIFDFDGDLVDFASDLNDFTKFPELTTPRRWEMVGKGDLGAALKTIRGELESGEPIDMNAMGCDDINFLRITSNDFRDSRSAYRRWLNKLITNPEGDPDFQNLLLIIPTYKESRDGQVIPRGGISERKKVKAQIDFSHSLVLLEAIDDGSFYALAKKVDDLISGITRARKPYKRIREDVLERLFNKGDLNRWLTDSGTKRKRDPVDLEKAEQLGILIDTFIRSPSVAEIQKIIKKLREGFKLNCGRPELLRSILKSLDASRVEDISVYAAIKNHHNMMRRVGRKIEGKCIGTTLLTKGLEFDTVAILDAHKFDSPKHLYVALTRCRKKLVIFSENAILSPYKE